MSNKKDNQEVEGSMLVSPEELAEKETEAAPKRRRKAVDTPGEKSLSGGKYRKHSGKIRIDFESMGRISLPSTLWFEDFDIEDVNDLVLAEDEEVLEELLRLYNKWNEDEDGEKVDIGDACLEDFFEILVGEKIAFNTKFHTHRWICQANDCQDGKDLEDREPSEIEIDLETLNYTSIEEAEKKIQVKIKTKLEAMSDVDYKDHLFKRHGEEIERTIEEEVASNKIKDLLIIDTTQGICKFRFTRVKDLYKAYKIAAKEFDPEIKKANNKYKFQPGMPGTEYDRLKEDKKKEIQRVRKEKAKKAIVYSQALSMIEFNGEPLTSDEEKIKCYRKLKQEDYNKLNKFLEDVKFGIQDEREFKCNHCGYSDKRWLQRRFTPRELLPINDTTDAAASRELSDGTGPDVYFAV